MFFLINAPSPLHAKVHEIVLWHSLAGHLGQEVAHLVGGFNQSQKNFVIKPVYKGDYLECLTSYAAAFRAKKAPALVQIFEVGKPTLLAPKGIIKPAADILEENKTTLPLDDFFPAVRNYYSEQGRLMAMPFNASIPVLFYNRDALAKIGYGEKNFPKTWSQFEALADKLIKAGYSCAYTSAYPGWILLESHSAIHGLSMIDAKSLKASYNNKPIIQHLERLRRWQLMHYFEYGGRASDASILFTSARCPIFAQSSGAYNSLSALVPFQLGMAFIPLDERVSTTRHSNIAGGAALWATANQSAKTYQGIAQFFSYLAKPKTQQEWHQHTGYLPLGIKGGYQTIYQKIPHPSLRMAEFELREDAMSVPRKSVQNQIRVINEESLEAIFSGIKTPKEAMDDAVMRANHALYRFDQNTK